MRVLGSKYARNAFAAWALPRTPYPLAGFKGPTSKGRGEGREGGMGGMGEGKGRVGGGKGRKGEGREGEGEKFDPHFSLPSDAPA